MATTYHRSRQPLQGTPEHYFAAYSPSGKYLGPAPTEAAATALHTNGDHPNQAKQIAFQPPKRNKHYFVLKGRWGSEEAPESFLDIPDAFAGDGSEQDVHEDGYVSYGHGLRTVQEFNRKSYRRARQPNGMPWAILLEVCVARVPAAGTFELGDNGAGVMELHDALPVRVALPTEEELVAQAIREPSGRGY